MARYIAKWDAIQRMEFDDLADAERSVQELPDGTVVEINDVAAPPGQPCLYILKAGQCGVLAVEGPALYSS
ncbi:MAG: hypothetical protein ABI619_11445 [Betaproteobacteria bacterium]